jgi:hypothetical protein
MIELLTSLFCGRGKQTQCDHRRVLQKQMLCETERFLDRHLRGCNTMQIPPLMGYREARSCDRPYR